jgi:hypothetical protein
MRSPIRWCAVLAVVTLPLWPLHAQPPDAVAAAQTTSPVPVTRPEQRKSAHDTSNVFEAKNAQPSSPVLTTQPQKGGMPGFDFYRDPLDSARPMMTFEELYQEAVAAKAGVMAAQRKLLESRYNLTPRTQAGLTMSRGKPIPIGPTARLREGKSWDDLAAMTPEAIRKAGLFPYPSLPHPMNAGGGGMVFP